jgi:preflagellin peptidase FlaK
MIASGPDLVRLLALPAFAWAAWTDLQVRRTDPRVWLVIYVIGGVAGAWEIAQTAPVSSLAALEAVSRFTVVPSVIGVLAAFLYRINAVGGGDAKAFFAVGLLFPSTHTYLVPIAEVQVPLLGVSSGILASTIIVNSFVFGGVYLFRLWKRNYEQGDRSTMMFVSELRNITGLANAVGMIQCKTGRDDTVMVDADVLRMWLRWQGVSWTEFDTRRAEFRERKSINEVYTVNDGAIRPSFDSLSWIPLPRGRPHKPVAKAQDVDVSDDPWAVDTFLDSIDHHSYGTNSQDLRDCLDYLSSESMVRVQPAFPLLVPLFCGVVFSLLIGEVVSMGF